MPTYVVTVKPNLLNDRQKDAIAKCITQAHAEVTGAPHYLAQIIFRDEECKRYVGGQPTDAQLWIRADIRAGRTVEQRKSLIKKIIEEVSGIADVGKSDIWVYLNSMEAVDMAEFGQLLSEPGKEKEWFASLPQDVQVKLASIKNM